MILYISTYGLYAVRHPNELAQRRIAPLEVVEVVPKKGEDGWKPVFSYYPSELGEASAAAERLDAESVVGSQ